MAELCLCLLCDEFTKDLIAANFNKFDIPTGPRWADELRQPLDWRVATWGRGFVHHESFAALKVSSASCNLCSLIYQDISSASSAQASTGRLELFPAPYATVVNTPDGTFAAVFSGDESYKQFWLSYPFAYQLCRQREWQDVDDFHPVANIPRAVPEHWRDARVWETAKTWMKICAENHANCSNVASASSASRTMPTRIIDVGSGSDDEIKLVISKDIATVLPYAALSHSWGGEIPEKLTTSTLGAMVAGIPVSRLPQNFQDAISITRLLNLRYLWIDALCIIQDSTSDWAHEASIMGSVYADSAVCICASVSASSTVGMLSTNRSPLVKLDQDLAIQASSSRFMQFTEEAPISQRGWCLQERLLAPRVLHVGVRQLYWECRTGAAHEDGAWTPEESESGWYKHQIRFLKLRKAFLNPPPPDGGGQVDRAYWDRWYELLTNYSSRKLSFGSDILPAISGMAQRFQDSVGPSSAQYAAGLWTQDMRHGILWGAQKMHQALRKVAGFNECRELSRPPQQMAPSWSWASVIGPVEFTFSVNGTYSCEIMKLDLSGSLMDTITAGQAQEGKLSVRGPVVEMQYDTPRSSSQNVGSLRVPQEEKVCFYGCIMDFERRRECIYHVLLVSWSEQSVAGLVLELVSGNTFRRVGVFQDQNFRAELPELVTKEIVII